MHCFGLLCTESTTFNGCYLPGTVFVLADTYRAGMLTRDHSDPVYPVLSKRSGT